MEANAVKERGPRAPARVTTISEVVVADGFKVVVLWNDIAPPNCEAGPEPRNMLNFPPVKTIKPDPRPFKIFSRLINVDLEVKGNSRAGGLIFW